MKMWFMGMETEGPLICCLQVDVQERRRCCPVWVWRLENHELWCLRPEDGCPSSSRKRESTLPVFCSLRSLRIEWCPHIGERLSSLLSPLIQILISSRHICTNSPREKFTSYLDVLGSVKLPHKLTITGPCVTSPMSHWTSLPSLQPQAEGRLRNGVDPQGPCETAKRAEVSGALSLLWDPVLFCAKALLFLN